MELSTSGCLAPRDTVDVTICQEDCVLTPLRAGKRLMFRPQWYGRDRGPPLRLWRFSDDRHNYHERHDHGLLSQQPGLEPGYRNFWRNDHECPGPGALHRIADLLDHRQFGHASGNGKKCLQRRHFAVQRWRRGHEYRGWLGHRVLCRRIDRGQRYGGQPGIDRHPGNQRIGLYLHRRGLHGDERGRGAWRRRRQQRGIRGDLRLLRGCRPGRRWLGRERRDDFGPQPVKWFRNCSDIRWQRSPTPRARQSAAVSTES